jgi:hypothetical protein
MHIKILIMAMAAIACAGCTMSTLRRETLTQVDSSVDMRFQELIENLALFADDASAIPVSASIYTGGSQIQDTASLGETTVWQRQKGLNGFGSQAATVSASRQIGLNWTVDPVVDPERLEAIRFACWWVVYGPQSVGPYGVALLARPDQVPGMPGRHFGVLDQMYRLPFGWLGKGGSKEAPKNAAYKACHGGASVWVMPEGIGGLADLCLVVQNISRVDINSPTLFSPGLVPPQWTFLVQSNNGEPVSVTVAVDYRGKLAPDVPFVPYRLDSLGDDPTFRSQIVAAGASK